MGEGLPFGDAAALVHLAGNIAGVLDVGVVSDRPHPAKRARASSTNPLAAPLPCNGSQESALDRFPREPLTIVTGPPGTGKTQLVVNAVTNAWLDGETVLVASTNNGAVNVAADRANADIGPATVLRTGNRKAREALADRVGKAVGAAAGDEAVEGQWRSVGGDIGARGKLAQTARHRARLLVEVIAVAELNLKLAETVEDQERYAQRLWNWTPAPVRPCSADASPISVRRGVSPRAASRSSRSTE